jgi:hypothetical protein
VIKTAKALGSLLARTGLRWAGLMMSVHRGRSEVAVRDPRTAFDPNRTSANVRSGFLASLSRHGLVAPDGLSGPIG